MQANQSQLWSSTKECHDRLTEACKFLTQLRQVAAAALARLVAELKPLAMEKVHSS